MTALDKTLLTIIPAATESPSNATTRPTKVARDGGLRPTALLVLADGTVYSGFGAGAAVKRAGELCFNTSMTGYQEILTDPSYAGQIINFTFPHIGIVGCNQQDNETAYGRQPLVAAAIFNQPLELADGGYAGYASWRGEGSLDAWLVKNNIPAISGIDTRSLTKKIRDQGAMMAIVVHDKSGAFDLATLKAEAATLPNLDGAELAKDAGCEAIRLWSEGLYQPTSNHYADRGNMGEGAVVVYDYGSKNNILRLLSNRLGKIKVVPAATPAEEVLAMNPAGVFLSNGPGDPAATANYAVPIIKKLLAQKDLPLFGVCLGHQLLALALGGKTVKMELGHRGANHPVKDLERDQVLITSQNHGFVVEADSLKDKGVRITHRSLFDGSVAGMELEQQPVFSVQFHPEASPGPQDNFYLFDHFVAKVREKQGAH